MCYCGCQFESYKYGPNEGCYCTKPRGCPCPEDVADEDEIEYWNEKLAEDEEERLNWPCQNFSYRKEDE